MIDLIDIINDFKSKYKDKWNIFMWSSAIFSIDWYFVFSLVKKKKWIRKNKYTIIYYSWIWWSIESWETPLDALYREVEEEISIKKTSLKLLNKWKTYILSIKNNIEEVNSQKKLPYIISKLKINNYNNTYNFLILFIYIIKLAKKINISDLNISKKEDIPWLLFVKKENIKDFLQKNEFKYDEKLNYVFIKKNPRDDIILPWNILLKKQFTPQSIYKVFKRDNFLFDDYF
jgi:hypothetical protein